MVFGPIRSRRLGSSLGINVLPTKGKICNFDCIYCECGLNKDGLGDSRLPSAGELEDALRLKLEECAATGTPIDSITFSGDGEPTLNPGVPEMVDIAISLRDKYFPKAVVSVLSNATTLGDDRIFEALRKVDNPILKLDAPTDALVGLINRPVGKYSVRKVVEGMKRFEGNFVLQTMFLRSEGFDSSWPEVLGPWMDIVREVRPREIMVYTIDRPVPVTGLQRLTASEMASLVGPLMDEGYKIQIKG